MASGNTDKITWHVATWLKLPLDSTKFSFGNGARAIGGGVVVGGRVAVGNVGAAVGGWVGRGGGAAVDGGN